MVQQKVSAAPGALVPFATLGELFTGIYRVADPTQEAMHVRGAIGGIRVVYPTIQTVTTYGRINAGLQRIGRKIPINDLWNAALALE